MTELLESVPILTLVLFGPLLGVLGLAVIPRESIRKIRLVALIAACAVFVASLLILLRFEVANAGFQMTQRASWIPSAGISYSIGIDGISLWMVLLTTILTPLAILASWSITDRAKSFYIVILILETGMLGVFLAIDLVLFYVFWEAMLVPMYFLIGIWGSERRIYAAVKFFLYTLAGSLLMLGAIVALYFVGPQTFDLQLLYETVLPRSAQSWMFAVFFISFAIKVPIVPFHTWLPDAHTEAPTAGSVMLAGVLLKMGAYGFLRFSFPLFPDAAVDFSGWLAALGVLGIVYGGVACIMQTDVKRLVAYSSVSHLGFVVLGIAALSVTATSGSVLQMLNHGLSTGALFLLVGMLYDRAHTRKIADFGGVMKVTPMFAGVFLLVSLSSLGLPGLNGFVGEFLILAGTYQVGPALAVVAGSGVVLAAIYMLWTYERIFTGVPRVPHPERRRVWKDLTSREWAVVAPLVALIVLIGVFPKPFLERIEPSVRQVVHLRSSVDIPEAAGK